MTKRTSALPERTCVACRQRRPQPALLRLVRVGDRLRVELFDRRGRGAYVCPSLACLVQAVERGGLARAFRSSVGRPAVEPLAAEALAAVRGRLVRRGPEAGGAHAAWWQARAALAAALEAELAPGARSPGHGDGSPVDGPHRTGRISRRAARGPV
jgi:hypothetical protein